MEKKYIEDDNFLNVDFTASALARADYENCLFDNCNFSNLNLSNFNFTDCKFWGCNFSLVQLNKTGFQDVVFKGCKLLGLHFDECSEFKFSVEFDDCMLDMSSFYKRKMKNQVFRNCSSQQVDFAECDLTAAHFSDSDLNKATFDRTILDKANFKTAVNYSINPHVNSIKKAGFSLPAAIGLLDILDINVDLH